jgi:hypothetical protein
MYTCALCKATFRNLHKRNSHLRVCCTRDASDAAATLKDPGDDDTPPTMRARRLPFLTTAGPARSFEGNVLALPPTTDVEPACTDFPICSGDPDSSESALQVDLVAAPAAGAVASREQTAEQPGEPSAGEVHHALKAALLEIGDRAGAKIADTLIRILRQRPLDLKLLPGDVDSIAQIRQRDKDDADIWLRGMQFVERTIADPEDPRATGVRVPTYTCNDTCIALSGRVQRHL